MAAQTLQSNPSPVFRIATFGGADELAGLSITAFRWRSVSVLAMVVLLHGALLLLWPAASPPLMPAPAATVVAVLVQEAAPVIASEPEPMPVAPPPETKAPQRRSVPQDILPVAPIPGSHSPAPEQALADTAAPEPLMTTIPVPAAAMTTPQAPPSVIPPRVDARQLGNAAPEYPAWSRRMGEQGRVLLDVFILPDGHVGQLRIRQSSGFERLDAAARDAVKRWTYVPAHRGDEAIAYWYVQPLDFKLD